jgi:hypothetical protein
MKVMPKRLLRLKANNSLHSLLLNLHQDRSLKEIRMYQIQPRTHINNNTKNHNNHSKGRAKKNLNKIRRLTISLGLIQIKEREMLNLKLLLNLKLKRLKLNRLNQICLEISHKNNKINRRQNLRLQICLGIILKILKILVNNN